MLPEIELFNHTIHMGSLFLFLHYPAVPFIYFLLKKRYGFNAIKTFFYSMFTLVSGVLGAVITSALANFILKLTSGGEFVPHESLSSYGISMFVGIFYVLYCPLFRKSFRLLTDYAAPAVFFVNILGKLVCVFDGCCYGPADPNGIYFKSLGYKAFPVQIYDTVFIAIIFVIMMILTFTLSKKHVGYLLPIANMLYAVEKGCLEEFRVYKSAYEGSFLGTGRTFWQYFLAVLFIGSLIWLICTIIWEKKGKADFDTATNIHLPDLSKILIFKNIGKETSKTKTNEKAFKGKQKKKHKK